MVNQYKGTYFIKAQSALNPGITKFFAKTRTKDWISEFKKEENDQQNEMRRLSWEKEEENNILVREKFDALLSSYKNTNPVLLKYFLQTVNCDNQKYIFMIYSLLYNNPDIFQRKFIIELLTNNHFYNQQPSTQCIVNKELLTIIFYIYAYKHSGFIDGQIYNCKIMDSYEANAIQRIGNLHFSIDYNLLSFIINNLQKSYAFDVELAKIMCLYSKLNEKQSRSICDVLSFIYSDIQIDPLNPESQIESSDDFVGFILIMGNFNPRFISYYKLANLSPVQRIYCEKVINNQNNAQNFINLSTEQQQWYIEIKKKSKAFYQIPKNLIDNEFREILYQDFPKIRELYGK